MNRKEFNLSQLLQLKRYEMPTEAFWDEFDARLQQQLASVSPAPISPIHNLVVWMRRLFPVTAICMVMIGMLYALGVQHPRFISLNQPNMLASCFYLSVDQVPTLNDKGIDNLLCSQKKVASLTANGFHF